MNNIWGRRIEDTMENDDYKIKIVTEPNGKQYISIVGDKFQNTPNFPADKLPLLRQAIDDAIKKISMINGKL